jgi:hypothetical protein
MGETGTGLGRPPDNTGGAQMRDRKPRLSFANVTATIALVAAFGMGGAYAADKIGSKDIGKNAVKSKHIKDGQVKAKDAKKLLMAATFSDVNCNEIEGSTGKISATPGGAGNSKCDVSFPRSVQDCTINVSSLFLQGVEQDQGGEATYRKLGGKTVRVGRYDSAGGTPTTGVFSISAICP